MINFAQLSEEGIVNWLRAQLQKREFMQGHCFTEREQWESIYELLFREQKMQVSDIEQYYIPFSQAGCMSSRQKLELMMFILEKDYGSSEGILYAFERRSVIKDIHVDGTYLDWALEDRLILSEEEKQEFFIQYLTDRIGLGILPLLKRLANEGIMLGECCPRLKEEPMNRRIAVCNNGRLTWLPVLAPKDKEELPRIIKSVVAKENRGELTIMNPFWECVKEDGTCITAIRPPAGKDWGLRILYGTARREQQEWEV